MPNNTASPSCIPPPFVLIAAADDSFRTFLEYIVNSHGFTVTGVRDGEALATASRQSRRICSFLNHVSPVWRRQRFVNSSAWSTGRDQCRLLRLPLKVTKPVGNDC